MKKTSAFDMNQDGTVTDKELELQQKIVELENEDKKADQQRSMATVALVSILVVTAFVFLPIMDPQRIESLSSIIEMFYIAMAGIIAAFFGSSAYMTVNK